MERQGRKTLAINPLTHPEVQRAVSLYGLNGKELSPVNNTPKQVNDFFRRNALATETLAQRPLCNLLCVHFAYSQTFSEGVDFGNEALNQLCLPSKLMVFANNATTSGAARGKKNGFYDLVFTNPSILMIGQGRDREDCRISLPVKEVRVTPWREVYITIS